jgi:predicted N-acetyltransferase YhbS
MRCSAAIARISRTSLSGVSHQRRGIGRELIRRTRQAGGRATLILLSAPKAVEYYPRLGFQRHPQAWILTPDDRLEGADEAG